MTASFFTLFGTPPTSAAVPAVGAAPTRAMDQVLDAIGTNRVSRKFTWEKTYVKAVYEAIKLRFNADQNPVAASGITVAGTALTNVQAARDIDTQRRAFRYLRHYVPKSGNELPLSTLQQKFDGADGIKQKISQLQIDLRTFREKGVKEATIQPSVKTLVAAQKEEAEIAAEVAAMDLTRQARLTELRAPATNAAAIAAAVVAGTPAPAAIWPARSLGSLQAVVRRDFKPAKIEEMKSLIATYKKELLDLLGGTYSNLVLGDKSVYQDSGAFDTYSTKIRILYRDAQQAYAELSRLVDDKGEIVDGSEMDSVSLIEARKAITKERNENTTLNRAWKHVHAPSLGGGALTGGTVLTTVATGLGSYLYSPWVAVAVGGVVGAIVLGFGTLIAYNYATAKDEEI